MKFVVNLIDKLNNYLGPVVFYNGNLFSYNIYNYFFKKNITNKVYQKNSIISEYMKNGYAKLDCIPSDQIDELNDLLIKYNLPQPGNNYSFNFFINDKIFDKIKSIVDKNLLIFLKAFSNFNNMNIKLGQVQIKRNYPIPKSHDKEAYSNFFHCDAYTCNLFKIFINLQDVNETDGPLILVKKDKSQLFFRKSGYKNRLSYSKNQPADYYYVNTGKKGDVLLCNTTELLHRAGDLQQGKYRDILFLDFVLYPFDEDSSLYDNNDSMLRGEIIKKVAKPKGVKNLIKLYKFCKKNKFLFN